jgi:hypothetical protein
MRIFAGCLLLMWSAWMFVVIRGYLKRPDPSVPFAGKVVLIILAMLVFAGSIGGIGLWLVLS